MDYEALEQRIWEMREDILSGIIQNVRINSVRSQAEEGAPYGIGPKAALENALQQARDLGFSTVVNLDNKIGYVEIGQGDEMVAILGHLDIVPAGDGWIHDPFEGTIEDNVLYGRGVADDKGPIIGALYGLKALVDLDVPLKRRIRLLFGTNEESGCDCVRHYIESGEELPVAGFTPDGEYPVIFAEKGILTLTVKKKIDDVGSVKLEEMEGGIASNVVAPSASMTLRGLSGYTSKDENIVLGEKDDLTRLTAYGKQAHAGTPELGVNAIIKLLGSLESIDLGGDFAMFVHFFSERLSDNMDGKLLGINVTDKESGSLTVNVGTIRYKNGEIRFTMDIRTPITADMESIYKNLSLVLFEYGLEISDHHSSPPLYVDKNSRLIQSLLKAYHIIAHQEGEPIAIGGGTYAKSFANMVAFGPAFPGEDNQIHQPEEHIRVQSLISSIVISMIAISELAN